MKAETHKQTENTEIKLMKNANDLLGLEKINDIKLRDAAYKAAHYKFSYDQMKEKDWYARKYAVLISRLYGKTVSDINWKFIYDIAASNDISNRKINGACFLAALVMELVKAGAYEGTDLEYVREFIPAIEYGIRNAPHIPGLLLRIEDPSEILICDGRLNGSRYSVYRIANTDPSFRAMFRDFLEHVRLSVHSAKRFSEFADSMDEAFGCCVRSYSDLSEDSFWSARAYYAENFSGKDYEEYCLLLINFYRRAVKVVPDILDGAEHLHPSLFDRDTLTKLIIAHKDDLIPENVYAFAGRDRRTYAKTNVLYLKFANKVVTKIFVDFFNNYTSEHFNHETDAVVSWAAVFEESLGDFASEIDGKNSFTGHVLHAQCAFYRERFNGVRAAVEFVLMFYRWLSSDEDYEGLLHSRVMSKGLLFSPVLSGYIMDRCEFIYYDPTNPETESTAGKVVFIVNGYDTRFTRFRPEDWVMLNVELLPDDYRNLVIRYFLSNDSAMSTLKSGNGEWDLVRTLSRVLQAKETDGYPNPDNKYFNNAEAIEIRDILEDSMDTLYTFNSFLKWASGCGYIKLDSQFFEITKGHDMPKKNKAKAIPRNDFKKIHGRFVKNAENGGLREMLFLCIFYLVVQTELRISHICGLKTTDIKSTMKERQHRLESNSKSSRGDKERSVITEGTMAILNQAIEETEYLREDPSNESLRSSIFIVPGKCGGAKQLTDNDFLLYLKKVCKSVGLAETYSTQNLRDTHMTESFKFVKKTGRSDADLKILSGHRNLDTTGLHYLDLALADMLAAAEGIVISGKDQLDLSGKVVSDDSPRIHEDSSVESGSGFCTTKECLGDGMLPCWTCKDFVTTPGHKKDFERFLEITNRELEAAEAEHEKESLRKKKVLIIQYIAAIMEFERTYS